MALSVGKKAEAGDAAKDHPAGHAFDDRMRTWWEPAGASVTHWLSVDLGEVCEVEATRLIFYRPGPFRYRIEVSTDGQAWTAVADKTGNTVPNCHEYDTFERANTRYVRVTITGKPEGVPIRVIELTVFGKKP